MYYIKMRPHLATFLASIRDLYELHIYTMGTRSYARKIAANLEERMKATDDAVGSRSLFHERITSRDDSGSRSILAQCMVFPLIEYFQVLIRKA